MVLVYQIIMFLRVDRELKKKKKQQKTKYHLPSPISNISYYVKIKSSLSTLKTKTSTVFGLWAEPPWRKQPYTRYNVNICVANLCKIQM